MRPAKIKKLIKNIGIDTNAKTDKAVLEDVLKVFENSQKTKSAAPQPNFWRTIMKSRITKVAAAVIIVAIGLFLVERNPEKRTENRIKTQVAKSPAEMLTLGSTTMAYRRGGMDAVEKQIEKAFAMLGPRTTSIPYEDLL